MGTVSWTVCTYANDDNKNLVSSDPVNSGEFVSSATPANITSAAPREGEVFRVFCDVNGWINFGGRAAANGTGHFVPAGQQTDFEVAKGDSAGAVSFKDA